MSERLEHPEAGLIERIRAIDERAPEELHRHVQALVAERVRGSRVRGGTGSRTRWSGRAELMAAGVAAAVAVIVLVLSGGDSSTLSVREISAATLRASTTPAPGESLRKLGALTESVDGVSFPYWKGVGWRASGARSDTIDGRTVRTVFYTGAHGERIGYAILAGTPAPAASGGVVVSRHGHPYRLLSEDGVRSVVWLRKGRLCVVAGRGVSSRMLLALASWHERAT
ncbi:MAG TPA: hypothetical protein VFY36_09540 [Solirubrobacteraceae bacterium]|nr:hypothetical protein [Solirubrobacteraceae bacterium]